MAPLQWDNICRFTVNGTFGGRNVANIFDMRIESGSALDVRAADIANQAGDIVNNWCDHLLPLLANDYTFTSVSWVDLNSLEGSTGEVFAGGDETLPQNGGSTEDPLPPNVAALVTKQAPGGGRSTRNGRTYLVGIRETQTDPGNPTRLTSAAQGFITAGMEAFSTGISNTELGEGYVSNMVVLHTRNQAAAGQPADIVATGASDVEALVCDIQLATQRRRLRR